MSSSSSPSHHSPALSQGSATSSRSCGAMNVLGLKCPKKFESDKEARLLWAEAKNARASYERIKTDKLRELEIILQSIQTTENALNEADHFIGKLYYVIKKSGLKPPPFSGDVHDTNSYTHTIEFNDDQYLGVTLD
ncbi:hypothetical protein CPB83DRAFT_900020 [Crepidotus variabilis]|uniref:Uncharacterized protein n=1 Tax=Crepidotus variabilis TaxID=179855 RepID=A0A9P6JI55_9AGAR|nr:hypothetical protein CPB83DRAFT_900020 [Crepidotus variabilis]